MTVLLELKDINAAYGASPVIHGVNMSVADGGITALLGANGAGKTTLLRAICNMRVNTSGDIILAGRRINGMATEEIARLGVAHVPDGRGTFAHLTTQENLVLGAYVRRDRTTVAQDMARVLEYFPRLRERLLQQAGTLSGGEQQMLAIARALMLRPRLLLLDEPSFGLAPMVVQEIFRTIAAINRAGTTVLLVEQNTRQALGLARRGYVLENGQVVLEGSGPDLLGNEHVKRAYLGM